MTGTVYQKWRRFARNGGVLGAGLRLRRGACIFALVLRGAAGYCVLPRGRFSSASYCARRRLCFLFFGYLRPAPRRSGRPPRFVFFHAASVQRLKVPRSTRSRRAAPRAEISPFSQAAFTNSNSSGRSFGLLPKRTPRASAAAMPSAWRRRMKARSVSAT